VQYGDQEKAFLKLDDTPSRVIGCFTRSGFFIENRSACVTFENTEFHHRSNFPSGSFQLLVDGAPPACGAGKTNIVFLLSNAK
jgi:hypothetical protein